MISILLEVSMEKGTAPKVVTLSLATTSLLLAAATASASNQSASVVPTESTTRITSVNSARALPSPLVLKHVNGDMRLIASHDSHSSHASHASHASGL